MLSPLDLKNKKIEPKKRKYYDKDEMDDYLELVFDNYKELYNENQELKKNVKTLSDGVQYYRSIESTMQKALVLAEKTAKETKDAAQLKAEAIEKDANTRAEKIVAEAEQEYEQLKDKCLYLVQQFNQYKMQLKQVAAAQLELITSDSFDVYSPELEAIQTENVTLPEKEIRIEDEIEEKSVEKMEESLDEMLEEVAVPESEAKSISEQNEILESEPANNQVIDENELPTTDSVSDVDDLTPEDLGKTMVIPDVKRELSSARVSRPKEEDLDILTADTIDLSSSIQKIKENEQSVQKPQKAKAKEVQDALVLEPVDAVVTEPMDLQPVQPKETTAEVLEPKPESTKEAPTLDSLLQSISIGKKNKKKKGQDEDPFEFLGSVDDF